MVDRKLLRLSAALSLIGAVVFEVPSLIHPNGANEHKAAFAAFASSAGWTAIHVAQFAGTAAFIAGVVGLFFALALEDGVPRWLGILGLTCAAAALALYGVVSAVDGVALKQGVDAWASASTAEQATRFAAAEAVRWLEWGVRSYQAFLIGLALLSLGIIIAWTGRIARPVGYFMCLNGLGSIAQGWVVGTQGFSVANGDVYKISGLASIAWIIWLLIVALRPPQKA